MRHHNSEIHGSKFSAGALRRSALAVAVSAVLFTGTLPGVAVSAIDNNVPINPPAAQAPIQGLADLVEAVRPAVVNIVVEGRAASGDTASPGGEHAYPEFFEKFFGQRPGMPGHKSPSRPFRVAGSGFFVSADGFVVTNNHVVDGAEKVSVILHNGEELEAEVRGSDPKTDLALLKVNAEESLPHVQFGDSDNMRAGDWVVAIGNPFGLGGSVTTGIISARGRDINSGPYDDYLQIDAPINRGNSGGPLFDLDGEVVGVNTAIFSPNGGNVGIGFAIPAGQAQAVISALQENGVVERGQLGVQIQVVTADLAEALNLESESGALVGAVTPDSPAERAGVEIGDVIVGFNGKQVEEMRELPRLVARTAPGTKATLDVLREGKPLSLSVTLGAQEQEIAAAVTPDHSDQEYDGPKLGVMVATLNDELRQQYSLPDSVTGTVVVQVQPESAAAKAGIQAGDVIRQVNGHETVSPESLVAAVRSSGGKLMLLVNREGNQWFIAVTPEEIS